MSHGGIVNRTNNGKAIPIRKRDVETRADIRKLFIDELGFKELYGTNSIPTAQLAAIGIQLKKIEPEFNVLGENDVYLSVTNRKGVKGAASLMADGSMVMFLNPSVHSNVGSFNKELKSEQRSRFKTKTDGKITNQYSYTARHEYGHLVQFASMKRGGDAASQRKEIRSVAKNVFGAKLKNPSRYGKSDEYEYFAESFASMTGGNPNKHGKAIRYWFDNR